MIVLAGLLGCSRSPASVADAGPLTVQAARELGVRIAVPLGAHVDHGPDFVVVELDPGMRNGRTLTLSRTATLPIPEGAVTVRRLPHGGKLAYAIRRASVGSGGPEADLEGRLQVGSANVRTRCSVQGDELFGSPDPTWCLPLLDTIVDAPADGGPSRDDDE